MARHIAHLPGDARHLEAQGERSSHRESDDHITSSTTLRARPRGTARIADNCLAVAAERAAKLFSVGRCVADRCAADLEVLQAHARRLRPERLFESAFQRAGRPGRRCRTASGLGEAPIRSSHSPATA